MANTITVTNPGNAPVTNVPIQIGRPFARGEIPHAPTTSYPTRAAVKLRWQDGSAKHAVVSFVIPSIPAKASVVVGFSDTVAITSPTAPAIPDVRLVIGQETRAAKDLPVSLWSDRFAVCADHGGTKDFSNGLRPIFHIRPDGVRVICENSHSEKLQDHIYDATIIVNGVTVFSQAGIPHVAGARWTKTFLTTPIVNVDHNLAYLCSTFLMPLRDTSITISEATISSFYTKFKATNRNLFGDGGWQQTMHVVGGRPDIGPHTGWIAAYLHSRGDHRMFEMISTMADLAGAWPMCVRECDPAKSAFGHPITVFDRPSLWLFDDRGHPTAQDDVPVTGPRLASDWKPDPAHEPEPYTVLYTVTGDPFYIEQAQFWASYGALCYNVKDKGPMPSGAIANSQTRGCSWEVRSRTRVADLSPDTTQEKLYFTRIIDDAFAYWEGKTGIKGTQFEGTPIYKYGALSLVASPLGFFDDDTRQSGSDTFPYDQTTKHFTTIGSWSDLWQHYMLIFVLGEAIDRGFSLAIPLFRHVSNTLIQQFQEPGYDPHNLNRYRFPVRKLDGSFFTTFLSMLPTYTNHTTPTFNSDVSDGYHTYAYGASTMLTSLPNGLAAYTWLKNNQYIPRASKYLANPKWAFLPRP